jgi:hypothetical protein
MGCNCKKEKRVETQVIYGTPEPIQEPKHQFVPIPEVTMVPESQIDYFNNIDTIEPINNGE